MNANVPSDQPTTPTTSQPAPPPAAAIVQAGTRTEGDIAIDEELAKTRIELENERQARKKAETDAAYALDEARRLKEAGLSSATAAPAKKKTVSRWGYFTSESED